MKALAAELQHNILFNMLTTRMWAKICIFWTVFPLTHGSNSDTHRFFGGQTHLWTYRQWKMRKKNNTLCSTQLSTYKPCLDSNICGMKRRQIQQVELLCSQRCAAVVLGITSTWTLLQAGNSGESSFWREREGKTYFLLLLIFVSFILYCILFSKLICCRLHRSVMSCWNAGLTGKTQEEQRGCALTCQFPHVPTQHHIHASQAGGRTGC